MAKIPRRVIERAIVTANDVPKEWAITTGYGNTFYELHLRMARIQELEYDFVWGPTNFTGNAEFSLPDPSLILVLDISLNDLVVLEPHQLVPFSQLRYLNASLNRIHRFTGIEVLHHLHVLDLSHNHINRLSSEFTACQSLVKLDLSVNQIDDLSMMPTLTNLRILNLRNNKLTSLNGVQALAMLEELYVQHNRLNDIAAVSSCLQLKTFNGSDNKLSSLHSVIQSLKDLKRLQTISLYGNPIEKDYGYQSTVVNNTTVCTLDNITVRNSTKRHRTHSPTTVGGGRYWPMVNTAREAFEQEIERKRRETEDKKRFLQQRVLAIEEDYENYAAKTRHEMETCLAQMRTLAYNNPRPFNYDYFRRSPPKSWQDLDFPERRMSDEHSNRSESIQDYRKTSYKNIHDPSEVLRHTYNELSKLQYRPTVQMGRTRDGYKDPWDDL